MSARIHPTALVDPRAELGAGVEVGPFAIIGAGVTLGDGTQVLARATIECNARIGRGVVIGVGSIVGGPPQDLKYAGEETWVEIGDRTVIREYSTINRATTSSYVTRVGAGCLIMSYVHLAHDCHVGDGVIIANGTQLAGHVTIHDRAILSGLVGCHQFVTIGTMAFVGGNSKVTQDVPPYTKAVGNPATLYGLNSVGLQRAGFTPEALAGLKRAYRLLFNSDLAHAEALERVRQDLPHVPEVSRFVEFVASAQRGVPA